MIFSIMLFSGCGLPTAACAFVRQTTPILAALNEENPTLSPFIISPMPENSKG